MPINMLYHAHSGLRYLVLLVGILAVLYFLLAYFGRRPEDRLGRILTAAFAGLLDLQIVLGLLLVVGGIYYPALIGHIAMMVLAAVFAHGASIIARRSVDARRAHGTRLVGVLLALLTIAGGVAAIGRGLFESRAPTLGS